MPKFAEYTTLEVGGEIERLFCVTCRAELLELAPKVMADRQWLALGGGSNLLVSDDDFAGSVLKVEHKGIEFSADGLVTVQAGETWDDLVAECVTRGFAGNETN